MLVIVTFFVLIILYIPGFILVAFAGVGLFIAGRGLLHWADTHTL